MKKTAIVLSPILSNNGLLDYSIIKRRITYLLGELNIEISDETLAVYLNITLSDNQKEVFTTKMEELGITPLFIEGTEKQFDKQNEKNTLCL